MANPSRRGILFVVSAPSGTGKTTLARRLLERVEGIEFSVSYTTRPMRDGEHDGAQYHFVDDATFDGMIADGAFLEWAHVFGGRYGTGRAATERILGAGRDLVLEIDVQGARQVRESAAGAVSIFVMPPDFASLRARLEHRASEAEAQMERRLARAAAEAGEVRGYDYVVVNDDLDRAVGDLEAIVLAERLRYDRCREETENIMSTFPGNARNGG